MESLSRGLHKALSSGDSQAVRALLYSDRIDVNFRDPVCGLQSALMRLCHVHLESHDRSDILGMMLDRGANVNIPDCIGRTVLTHACIAERTDMMAILSSVPECDPSIADGDGNHSLMYAVKSRNAEVVKKLLECFKHKKLDVHHNNNKGLCALTEAESRFDSEICRLLIKEGGADPSRLDVVQYNQRGAKSPRSATPETIPTSPKLHTRRQRGSRCELSPLVIASRQSSSLEQAEPPIGNERLSYYRSHSLDSNSTSHTDSEVELPEVLEEEEDDGEDDIEDLDPEHFGALLQRRRNSKSLPDLRSMIEALSSTPPTPPVCSSPKALSDETFPKSGKYERSHTLDEVSPLPKVYEEDEPPVSPPASRRHRRRGSLSLPDLRDCGQFLVESNRNASTYDVTEEDSGQESDIERSPSPYADASSSNRHKLLTLRGRADNRVTLPPLRAASPHHNHVQRLSPIVQGSCTHHSPSPQSTRLRGNNGSVLTSPINVPPRKSTSRPIKCNPQR